MGLEYEGPAGIEWFHLVLGLLGLGVVGSVLTIGAVVTGVTDASSGFSVFGQLFKVATLAVALFLVVGDRPVLTASLRAWYGADEADGGRDVRLRITAGLEAFALCLGTVGAAGMILFSRIPRRSAALPSRSLATEVFGLSPEYDPLSYVCLALLGIAFVVRLVSGVLR